jgi:hypothetical protein|tara:strand:+ start:106 stop:540 length:435 start_codon:yes stop_codon:yes gene_type:complete
VKIKKMNQFWQKEVGGVLGALLLTTTPILADDYQRGYSSSRTCFKTEYREEYIPGNEDSPGYVKSWKETIEVPCQDEDVAHRTYRRHVTVYENVDTNDCSDGKIAGGLLGGGLGAAVSRGDGRWWAIPLGAVVGSHIGCDLAGG